MVGALVLECEPGHTGWSITGSKWIPDFLNRKSFQVRFVVHFLNWRHACRNIIRRFCAESCLQPERCSISGSANRESDDARFEH